MTLANRGSTIAQIPANLDAPIARDVLTQGEYEAFRDALPTWRDRLIAMVLRNTGLRINEILFLEVHHCALDGPAYIIYVQRSKKRNATKMSRSISILAWEFNSAITSRGPSWRPRTGCSATRAPPGVLAR